MRALLLLLAVARPGDYFPTNGEAPGWTLTAAPRVFLAADLHRHLDGDAERYLRAGVVRTLAAGYRYRGRAEAAVDVHVMAAPEGARRIFDSESAAGSEPVQLGDAARHYGQSLTFHQGPFFVRLVALDEAPGISDALLGLARRLAAKLPRSGR
jgi:hypothetical protein